MITKDNLIEYILEQSDSFKKYLELSDSDWENEGAYTVLAEYSRYILDLYKKNKNDQVKASFELANDVFSKGDQYVKEAITIGLLETIQNNISWEENLKKEDFVLFLPETLKKEWENIDDFWERGK